MVARFAPLTADDPPMVAGYTLRARIGVGGMGRVYLAFSPGGRALAIKVVRPEFAADEEFRRRFQLEVAAAQRVQGMFTAPVVDADTRAPLPWLATAYVPGPSLRQAVEEHGPLPLPTVFRLMAGVAEGLADVHACGLVHRDLKPANVLLAADGPRVIDFGIAHAVGSSAITQTGMIVGTPAFMAPEQVRGRSATPAVDVFALANLAVFAATGRMAFGDGNQDALLHRILHEPPNLDRCPPELRTIVERCLAKEPGDRPTLAEIMTYARAQQHGDTMQYVGSWLPQPIVTSFPGYDTAMVPPPPPRTPTFVLPPQPIRPVHPTRKIADRSSVGIGVGAVIVLGIVLALIHWAPKTGNTSQNGSSGTVSTFAPPPVYTTFQPDPTTFQPTPTTSDDPPTSDPTTIPTTPPFDPNSLNDESTDSTPGTPAVLLSNDFTDADGRHFTRAAGWIQPCRMGAYQTSQVQQILLQSGCQNAIVGDYVNDAGTIMISVHVMGLANRATAITTFDGLVATHGGDLGIVCPAYPGAGSVICTPGATDALRQAAKEGQVAWRHRYVIAALSMYTNLSPDTNIIPILTAASIAAANNSGPSN